MGEKKTWDKFLKTDQGSEVGTAPLLLNKACSSGWCCRWILYWHGGLCLLGIKFLPLYSWSGVSSRPLFFQKVLSNRTFSCWKKKNLTCQNLSDKGNRQNNSEASSAFRPLPPRKMSSLSFRPLGQKSNHLEEYPAWKLSCPQRWYLPDWRILSLSDKYWT